MGPRPTSARIEPLGEYPPELAEILGKTLIGPEGKPINIFGTLAHHPKLLKRFNVFGGLFLQHGLLPPREREVVILRVGWNCRAVYEFGQHTVIGRRVGLTDDDLALIALADDLCSDNCVSDVTWAALRPRWNDAELIELVMVAGNYRLVSGFLNSMGVQLDPGVPGWPDGTTA